MNIVKSVKKLGNKVKKGYDNTQINPFKIPEKIKVELVINYKESLKTLDIQEAKKIFKQIRKEVVKELE